MYLLSLEFHLLNKLQLQHQPALFQNQMVCFFVVVSECGTIDLRGCHSFASCCFKLDSLSLLSLQTLRQSNLHFNATDS